MKKIFNKERESIHIAFAISSMGSGGAERVVANLSNKFVEMGYKVTIITFNAQESYYHLNSDINLINYNYKCNNKIGTFINSIKSSHKAFVDIKPDVIISFLTTVNITSIIANLFRKTPIIISERNDPNNDPSQWYYRILRNIFYRFSDGYVFQTNNAREFFSDSIKYRSVIIHNPVYINEIENTNNMKKLKEIVSVGRLEPQKNYKLLIDAFEIIHKKFNDYQLTIFGEGHLRNELESYVSEKGLEEYIKLPGRKKDIYNKIKNCKLFVLSSDYEGMPNALMEAMALGLPCIATNCQIGGPSEIIKNAENGILIEKGNLEQMVNAIEYILENDCFAYKLGNEAKKIMQSHSIDNIYVQWENYILKVLWDCYQ